MKAVLTASLVLAASANLAPPHRARGGKAYELYLEREGAPPTSTDAQYWDAPQDHFDDANTATYKQKYYVNSEYYQEGGPIFLEIGGEGPVGGPPGGYIASLGQERNALLIQLEHRFYGESLPNGNVDTDNLKLLTVENALADLAGFIDWYTAEQGTTGKWFAFGGSYPGALSGWFRKAYPDHTAGSLSSSGVVNAINEFTAFDERVATAIGDECADNVRAVTAAFERAVVGEDATNATNADAKALFGCAADMWDEDYFYMLADSAAMADQYGSKFALCDTLGAMGSDATDATKMETFANFTNTYWGADFGSGCFYDSACLADKSKYEAGATDRSWRWQKCYQLAYFQPAPAEGSLRSSVVTMDYHYEQCMKVFGLAPPDVSNINDKFGAEKIQVDKVFFSDFSDDPWREASVVSNDDIPATSEFHLVQCDECGHCMDFSTPSDTEPAALTAERQAFEVKLDEWLEIA
mmetsp:Transcript_64794/g.180048  ORF Transcript_64794/g.180048 Transcript_64794/m.180048 type:complete len:468 (-) Transcript_64794:401-1804(-)|eukprot:CAMPEP_0119542584 /NCGR_PEP_ID=MMETSP1344-20130328/53656_1 /TAXON_ID=236787 /ORGANISM="Florenciella parvula, Strain CCMP2471" /LENGTH=467 /DNA_ID=CAMNT_0007586819 /DNA_START=76 /DNA_END=1479 /DNA_ORIENTATION=+